MDPPLDIAAIRHDYVALGLRRADLDPDPIRQFATWFNAAVAAQIRDVNAMALATATPDGASSIRIVLLKEMSQNGFVFFTNYTSEKGRQIEANPRVALNFYWIQLERQIRINGRAKKISAEESDAYFQSRPPGSQLSAWASSQSEIIPNRTALEEELTRVTQRFADGRVPRPAHWGGYRVIPETVEFWQGRANRLHDRFRYTRQDDGAWRIDRLAP